MWQQILQYLFIKKKHPDAPKSIDLKLMHGMNRISILVFLTLDLGFFNKEPHIITTKEASKWTAIFVTISMSEDAPEVTLS